MPPAPACRPQNAAPLSANPATVATTPRQTLGYTIDLVGNFTRITDTTRSEVNHYAYDSLDRLTWITTTTGSTLVYQQLYTYDAVGNILSAGSQAPSGTHQGFGFVAGHLAPTGNGRGGVTGFVGGTATSLYAQPGWPLDPALYYYTDTEHVHAVTRVSGVGTFDYDANGNMTLRVEGGRTYTQTFDVENRLESVVVSGVLTPTTYHYDANGQMIKKIAPDGKLTVYLGLVEYELTGLSGTVAHTTSYYNVPSARVVRLDNTLSYVLTDHLGSTSVTLTNSGVVDGEVRYYAYGETRINDGSLPTARMYTGQLREDNLGLDYFNARWYISSLGRWVQPDTIVPIPSNPQAFNRYAYSLSNPLKYTDPSGHCPAPSTESGNVICVDLFIQTNRILLGSGFGDGRGPHWDSALNESRGFVYIFLDDQGVMTRWEQHIETSCTVAFCAGPFPEYGSFVVVQDENTGGITVNWELVNGVAGAIRKANEVASSYQDSDGLAENIVGGAADILTTIAYGAVGISGMDEPINGTLVLTVDQGALYKVKSMVRDPYPSLSVYQYANGVMVNDLLQRPEWPPGFPNIGLQPWIKRDVFP